MVIQPQRQKHSLLILNFPDEPIGKMENFIVVAESHVDVDTEKDKVL